MSKAREKETKKAPPIRLINRTRRPICFRAQGGTVRLAPGEQRAELPAQCAGNQGVRNLCAKGILTVIDPSRAPGAASGKTGTLAGASPEKAEQQEQERSAGGPSAEAQPTKKPESQHGKTEE